MVVGPNSARNFVNFKPEPDSKIQARLKTLVWTLYFDILSDFGNYEQ